MESLQQTQQGKGSGDHGVDDPKKQSQPIANNHPKQEQLTGEDVDEGNHSIADLGELGMFGSNDDHAGNSGKEEGDQKQE